MHFTEHLVGAFGKSPWENNLIHETLSLLIRRLKSYTGIPYNDSHQNPREKLHTGARNRMHCMNEQLGLSPSAHGLGMHNQAAQL
jgi:hypothetical protein